MPPCKPAAVVLHLCHYWESFYYYGKKEESHEELAKYSATPYPHCWQGAYTCSLYSLYLYIVLVLVYSMKTMVWSHRGLHQGLSARFLLTVRGCCRSFAQGLCCFWLVKIGCREGWLDSQECDGKDGKEAGGTYLLYGIIHLTDI